ncbi:hypothetical protein [Cupriavidus necator]|uniref:hypothetical protein n=1 Tax=Cupriavidus necator TaxID=106590 RepID=UPI00339D9F11
MNTATQLLFDDVFAVFRRACGQQQYGVAEHLLAALERLAGGDNRLLDEVYLSFAWFCEPGDAGTAGDPGKMKTYTEERSATALPRIGSERPMRKRMNQFWRVVVLLTLALALPLRAQAGLLDSCCIAGIAQMPAHMPVQAAQASVEAGSPDDCVSQSSCAGDRHVSGPSRLPCTASACAVFAGTPLTIGSPTDAWTSELVAHPEFAYHSIVPRRLERPPTRIPL